MEVFAQAFVNVGEINDELVCFGRSGWAVWECGEFWVVTFVGEEWGRTRSRAFCIVVGEFGDWQPIGPIVLLVVTVDTEVLFKYLINPLSLAVSLWMIARREVKANTQH